MRRLQWCNDACVQLCCPGTLACKAALSRYIKDHKSEVFPERFVSPLEFQPQEFRICLRLVVSHTVDNAALQAKGLPVYHATS